MFAFSDFLKGICQLYFFHIPESNVCTHTHPHKHTPSHYSSHFHCPHFPAGRGSRLPVRLRSAPQPNTESNLIHATGGEMRNMCTGVQRRDCDWHPVPNISSRSSILGPLSGLRWVHADDVIENK